MINNLCTIGMRGGSKGVPNKNLRELHGKPLMAYTIAQAKESGLFRHIVVSTDSEEIAESARNLGAEAWFLRPPDLATDEAPKLPVIRHAFLESESHYGQQFDVLVDLDVTSPLRLVGDITGAYKQFSDEDADILITASPSRRNPYFNMVENVNGRISIVKQMDKLPVRRQDAPRVYDMNASIYIWKRDALLNNDTLFTENTSLFVMPEERSVDIDTEIDWDFVEFIMEK
ncbi:MAG: acylneuraminate cytidylyltransferase family protein [Candidatus Scalindua sp.]|nr:acylneuraminate cytidylyltransferase family protein [Candidatus Scalindua sp.]MBT6563096.1 acylneuraminate cytidylyltransferase family protein [Candidatus Scalindua sp.]